MALRDNMVHRRLGVDQIQRQDIRRTAETYSPESEIKVCYIGAKARPTAKSVSDASGEADYIAHHCIRHAAGD